MGHTREDSFIFVLDACAEVEMRCLVLLGLLLMLLSLSGCIEVDTQVGPDSICGFTEEFAGQDEEPWNPIVDSECGGYARDSSGYCLDSCDAHVKCVPDFYCDFDSGTCQEKTFSGSCQVDAQCVSDLCMCEVCADEDRVNEILFEAVVNSNLIVE